MPVVLHGRLLSALAFSDECLIVFRADARLQVDPSCMQNAAPVRRGCGLCAHLAGEPR